MKSSKDFSMDDNLADWFKDSQGYEYDEWFPMNTGTIFPGGRLETTIKNRIPDGVSGLLVVFDGYLMNKGKVYIRIPDKGS